MVLRILRLKGLLTFAFIISVVGLSYAQITVSGQVTDAEDGSGIPGVSILEQGTTNGTITDFEGNYTLQVSEDATLEFSFVGYETQEVPVSGRTTIDVALSTAVTALSEVVVVGYGTQTKQEVTSAVTSVKPEDFNQGNVNDPAQLLQGKVPGLTVVRQGGNPNQDFTIRLRGLASIGPNNSPLIIIDGVPSQSLSQIDPNDIASIDVLKDGAAAAIYGTRGSAGVIIVTTKTGRRGQTTVNYNGYVAVEDIAKSVPVLDAAQYRERNPTGDIGASTDWFDAISQSAASQTHNLSMGGGSDLTRYRVSLNYRDQNGIQRQTGFNQLNSRITIQQKALNEKLTLRGNLGLTSRQSNFGWNEAFRYASIYNPTQPIRVTADDNEAGLDPADFTRWDGYYQNVQFDYYNPVAIIEQNVNEGTRKDVNFNFKAEYEFMEGLYADVQYGQQYRSELFGQYRDKNSFWVGADRNGLARRQTEDRIWEIVESTVRYESELDNGLNLKILGGYSWQENTTEGFFAEGGDFVTDAFSYHNLSGALDFANGLGGIDSWKFQSRLIAFFGRLNLNFNETYFLMASLRYEGSSMFGAENKWGTFPAVSAGVDIDRLYDLAAFDQLKLRASFGQTGTLPPEPYLSLQRLGPTGNAFIDGSFKPAFGPVSNPNPNLRWESKQEIDVGVDFAVLDYRLNGSIDYYTRNTTDLLLNFDVPVPPNLFSQTWLNIGEFRNSGVEVGLRYLIVDNANTSYETGINFSTFNTELISLSSEEEGLLFGDQRIITNLGSPGQNGTFMIQVKEGAEIGNIFGPEHDESSPVAGDGSWNIIDQNGDGTIDDNDDVVIGNGLPDFEIGWSNTVSFGNFDLNAFFRGAFGHDLVNTYRAFYENPNLIDTYNVLESSFDPDLEGLSGGVNVFGSYHVENASYLKLDNATLGYNVPVPDGGSFNSVRLYLSGQNLFVITGYKGVDPEVRFSDDDGGVLAPGIDRRNTWFRTWTATFGVQLGF